MSLPCPLIICGSLENSLGSGRPNPDRLVQRAVAEPAPLRLPGSRAFSIGRWMPQRGQAGKLWPNLVRLESLTYGKLPTDPSMFV